MLDRCPRCGHAPAGDASCAKCGVVYARLREPSARHVGPAPSSAPAGQGRGRGTLVAWALVPVLAAGIYAAGAAKKARRARAVAAAPAAGAGAVIPADAGPHPASLLDVPVPERPAFAPPAPPPEVEVDGLGDGDAAEVTRLSAALRSSQPLSEADLDAGARLAARYPQQPMARQLAVALFMGGAFQDRAQRRFDRAESRLRRAAGLDPAAVPPWLGLIEVAFETGDWARAESAARTALLLDPRSVDALRSLGFALLRQDRNREAEETLRQALELSGGDAATQAMLARIQKGLADERGMRESNLSHFHVRYDGEAHDAVGREILRALERHFATLAATLGHQPQGTIPVILFTRQGYYDASGAPAWSGGVYDGLDGRIRIPVGGLDASLTPDMDETLIHELTHAFVADLTRGVAPREIHEGLAQYMEGKRVERILSREQLRTLADGRAGGVGGFYLAALAQVEYLVAVRGMGGMTDLLREMGTTGSVDEAFRSVHGSPYRDVQRAWAQRMRQQYGS